MLQYADQLKIFLQRNCVAEYPLPPDGVKNERFSPPGGPKPRHQPKNRIVQLETLRRIAWLCISQGEYPLPDAQVDEDFQQRPAYQEGCLTDEPDLSIYDDMLNQEEDNQPENQDRSEESEDQDG